MEETCTHYLMFCGSLCRALVRYPLLLILLVVISLFFTELHLAPTEINNDFTPFITHSGGW